MPVTSTPVFPQAISGSSPFGYAKILPADTTTLKTLYTAGPNGSRIDGIFATSTETANNRDLQFVITIGAVDYILGTVQCPLNAGFTNAVPTLAVFQSNQFAGLSVDPVGNREFMLPAGAVLKVKSLTTLAAGKEISVIAHGGDL